jgi:hypothetical protein
VPGIEGAEWPRKMVESLRHFRLWDEIHASYVMDVNLSRESQKRYNYGSGLGRHFKED